MGKVLFLGHELSELPRPKIHKNTSGYSTTIQNIMEYNRLDTSKLVRAMNRQLDKVKEDWCLGIPVNSITTRFSNASLKIWTENMINEHEKILKLAMANAAANRRETVTEIDMEKTIENKDIYMSIILDSK